ncbi:tyrosine-type recombinase/integrase [Comamonas granuli]|uniref:tyrosine-type recombinase/integrase n=1 Tax=Comamonas granuli TaxID=290309 RepID=UPI0005A7995C|nr:integrase arm-type DNA-binding domain-containing protein [Comamonas granuli]
MPLTELQCKKAICPPDRKRVRLSDEKNLYLEVTAGGGKYWFWKYRIGTKETRLALGVYPEVSLAQARDGRDDARKMLKGGGDPGQARREAKLARAFNLGNTFEEVARQWWAHWKDGKSPRHADYAIRRLESDAFPMLGARPIASLTAKDLTRMAKAVQDRGALDLAHRVLQMAGQIMRFAVAHDLIERNPAADVKPSDTLKSRKKEHYPRIEEKELPELLRKIEAYQGGPYTRLAMQLMALTFVRTSELIGARWAEFHLEAAEWRIPAARMKMKTPHIVPLSPQAVEVLRVLQTLSGGRELLFPGERDHSKPMSNNTILMALGRMGFKGRMTGHGFRGVASTILHEQGFAHHAIELQLAHQERNEVSAAYNHALYLKERRAMMCDWANHLDKLRRGADVVPLRA